MPVKKKKCQFCVDQIPYIDYKNIKVLYKFVSLYKKIVPRYYSGICLYHQKKLARAIKNARIMGLMKYVNR